MIHGKHITVILKEKRYLRLLRYPKPWPSLMRQDVLCKIGMPLIQQGWQVLAIDQQEEALRQLRNGIPFYQKNSLTTLCRSFEDLSELPGSTLVNATFSLPFCKPDKFSGLWQLIVDCLLPGGRFAGHFFGVEDSWKDNPAMTFHQSFEVQQLLSGFTIEVFQEMNKDGKTVSGKDKHWHVFHVVARKDLT